jgi:hypothetical protein
MEWAKSPGYFCTATKSIRDIAQRWIDGDKNLPKHIFEPATEPAKAPRCQTSKGAEYEMTAVYIDDFLMAAVQSREGNLLQKTARATLHAIHSVFPPATAYNPPGTKDPILEKKLAKGNAQWGTTKEILGYKLDGYRRQNPRLFSRNSAKSSGRVVCRSKTSAHLLVASNMRLGSSPWPRHF